MLQSALIRNSMSERCIHISDGALVTKGGQVRGDEWLTAVGEPTNPLDPNTPTSDVTQESPGGPSVVPVASGTGPTSPTALGRYSAAFPCGRWLGEVWLAASACMNRRRY